MATSVQFIKGLDETIANISLRKLKDASARRIVFVFERLQAMETLKTFTSSVENLWLTDEEGEIQVFPRDTKFFYKSDDDLAKVECMFEIDDEAGYQRVMRFLERYAADHGFEFGGR